MISKQAYTEFSKVDPKPSDPAQKSLKGYPDDESEQLVVSPQQIYDHQKERDQHHQQEEFAKKQQSEKQEGQTNFRENSGNKKTRRLIKLKNEIREPETKRENIREKIKISEEKTDKQIKLGAPKKQQQKNLQAYIKIVDYLKKIQWDQQNSQNKMNPFHFMTATCFWFWVCAQYFSYNFFVKRNPQEAANQIINRVQRIVFSIPLRLNKSLLQQIPNDLLSFQTKNLKQSSQKISQILLDLVENKGYQYHFQNVQKSIMMSQVNDDDLFRCSTRSILYNYVKSNYSNQLQHLLNIEITQDQQIVLSENNSPHPEYFSEKIEEEFTQHINKFNPISTDNQININEIAQIRNHHQQQNQTKKKPNFKQIGKEELLLSSLVNLPLDKVISILESSIPEPQIPQLTQPYFPITNDPFHLISQIHPLEYQFLDYLKKRRSMQSIEQNFIVRPQKNKYEQNIQQDAKCQICTDGDYTDDNLIVFCSTCNISLHQRCVGLVKVPSESWICQVCNAFGPKGRWLRCALCTVKGGALKRTTITSDISFFKEINPSYHDYLKSCTHLKAKQQFPIIKQELNDQLFYDYYDPVPANQQIPNCHYVWIHYACSIWVPECYFQQRNGIINIKGIETIDKKRFKNQCEICKTSKTGAAVKCSEELCEYYYHAECARKAGIYMQQRHLDKMYYSIYCNAHKPLKITRLIESKSKKYKDEIIKFCRAIEKYVETYKIANVPFKLLKSCKRGNRIRKETRIKDSKEDRETENQDFMRKLKDYLISNRKLVIQLKKVGDNRNYRVLDIEEPIKRALRSNISKNDQIWQFFVYKNLSSSQLFKKYKKIMKDNINLRDSFTREIKNQSKSERKREKRRTKEIQYQNMTVEEDPDKIYCICRKKYIVGEFMLECQICSEWFHFKCIGFIGKEEDAEKVEFNCYKCEKYQSQQEKQNRREKFQQFYDPNFNIVIPQSESEESQQSQNRQSNSEQFEEFDSEENKKKQEGQVNQQKEEQEEAEIRKNSLKKRKIDKVESHLDFNQEQEEIFMEASEN